MRSFQNSQTYNDTFNRILSENNGKKREGKHGEQDEGSEEEGSAEDSISDGDLSDENSAEESEEEPEERQVESAQKKLPQPSLQFTGIQHRSQPSHHHKPRETIAKVVETHHSSISNNARGHIPSNKRSLTSNLPLPPAALLPDLSGQRNTTTIQRSLTTTSQPSSRRRQASKKIRTMSEEPDASDQDIRAISWRSRTIQGVLCVFRFPGKIFSYVSKYLIICAILSVFLATFFLQEAGSIQILDPWPRFPPISPKQRLVEDLAHDLRIILLNADSCFEVIPKLQARKASFINSEAATPLTCYVNWKAYMNRRNNADNTGHQAFDLRALGQQYMGCLYTVANGHQRLLNEVYPQGTGIAKFLSDLQEGASYDRSSRHEIAWIMDKPLGVWTKVEMTVPECFSKVNKALRQWRVKHKRLSATRWEV